MPIYEYHCTACDHDFSRNESLADHERAKVTCPKCRSSKVERTFTSFYAKTGRKS
jgi:putative FmdB family regulatory protein